MRRPGPATRPPALTFTMPIGLPEISGPLKAEGISYSILISETSRLGTTTRRSSAATGWITDPEAT